MLSLVPALFPLILSGGPFGGATLALAVTGGGNPIYVQKNFNANLTSIYWGQWIQLNAIGYTWFPLQFLDGSTGQVYLSVAPGGQISVYSGSPGGSHSLLATNVAATLTIGRWTFVELGVVFSTSVGSVELKFNGVDVISLTGSLNTAPSGSGQASVMQIGSIFSNVSFGIGITMNFADIYVVDGSGGTNNTFLGPGQAIELPPNANNRGKFTGTPNTGSNTFRNVDSNPSSGSSYNFDSTAGHKDSFAKVALPGNGLVDRVCAGLCARGI